MNTVAIIQARLSSTRLKEKVLLDINGQPMLWRVVERARRIKGVDDVVVATSFHESDWPLIAYCQRAGVPVYRGGTSVDDVLGRYFDVATQLVVDVILRITSDCPCLDPGIGSQVLELFRKEKAEYASNVTEHYIDGTDVEAFTYTLLTRAHQEATEPGEREHVTTWMRANASKQASLLADGSWPKVKLSVDTAAELDLVQKLYAALGDDFGLAQALAWWKEQGMG